VVGKGNCRSLMALSQFLKKGIAGLPAGLFQRLSLLFGQAAYINPFDLTRQVIA